MESGIPRVGESAVILNRVTGVAFTEMVTFEQSLCVVKEKGMRISGEKVFQAEETAMAKRPQYDTQVSSS